MSKLYEKYDIRRAKYDEIDDIMCFIETNWKKGHILGNNRDFFEYEMVVDGKVNCVIAKDRITGEIHGMDGFIMASKDPERLDIWGSMWMVIPSAPGFLGMEIDRRVKSITNCRTSLTIGGNKNTTVPIMRIAFGYKNVSRMNHYYCLSNRSDYNIAKINHYEKFQNKSVEKTEVVQFEEFGLLNKQYDFSKGINSIPYKDGWYFKHRYYDHPIYKYSVYGLRSNKKIEAVLVCRVQKYNNTTALRIVDYVGEERLFGGLGGFFEEQLNEHEYIDMYCHGFCEAYIKQAGMIRKADDDTNIIPNFFSPYVSKNIEIWVGAPDYNALFFRADGDQDRPN